MQVHKAGQGRAFRNVSLPRDARPATHSIQAPPPHRGIRTHSRRGVPRRVQGARDGYSRGRTGGGGRGRAQTHTPTLDRAPPRAAIRARSRKESRETTRPSQAILEREEAENKKGAKSREMGPQKNIDFHKKKRCLTLLVPFAF